MWFQVAGTICNLRCTHCFIACSPDNHRHEMLTLADVQPYLEESVELGVRDYYLTGGEPFLNRELLDILEAVLRVGPVTVLTHGLLLDDARLGRLRALSDASIYSLDLRISIDGLDAETHDAIRGPGTFDRAVDAAVRSARAGLNPVLTVTDVDGRSGGPAARARFLARMVERGLPRPRLKLLPMFRVGREATRQRPYEARETLRGLDLSTGQLDALQCASSRMVTSRGVFACPIRIDEDDALLGPRLADSLRPIPLRSPACHTCHVQGATCRT